MNKTLLNRIRNSFENFPNIYWIESADVIRGVKIKAEVVTKAILNIMDEHGFQLRHVSPYTLDTQYLLALFEPKEINNQ
jgi:hypothetical protein